MTDIRIAKRSELPAVAALLSLCLGNGYVTVAKLRDITDNDGVVLLAEDGGQLAGSGAAVLLRNATDAFPVGQRHLAAQLELLAPVGKLMHAAVAPFARRRGILRMLIAARTEWLRERGAQTLITEAWVKASGEIPVARAFVAAGFAAEATVRAYWSSESERDGYCCPECGHPCRCAATLFIARP
jgi:GNAT superfamily N-acetyltransferase